VGYFQEPTPDEWLRLNPNACQARLDMREAETDYLF